MELDKIVFEWIVDFFVYLVCNGIDYGVEMLDVCFVKGKFEMGVIMLKVFY